MAQCEKNYLSVNIVHYIIDIFNCTIQHYEPHPSIVSHVTLEWTHAQKVASCVAITFYERIWNATISEELLCELDNERDRYYMFNGIIIARLPWKDLTDLFTFPLLRWKHSVLNIRLLYFSISIIIQGPENFVELIFVKCYPPTKIFYG